MHTNYSVSLSTKCLKKPSIAHQYAALLTLLNRNVLPIKADAGCLPSSKLQAKFALLA